MEKYHPKIKEIIKRTSKEGSMLRITKEYINEIEGFGGPMGICSYIIKNRDNLDNL